MSAAEAFTETRPAVTLAPVQPGDRIFNLDILRGLAILGILTVNAVTFAWPAAVEFSPAARPFAMVGADKIGFWITDVFFQDKFRTLFTMLFGVSIYLVGGERQDEARGRLLWRRLLWLCLFGLVHGLALWFGDILLHYAYAGLLMMVMRSMGAGRLLWIGGGVTLFWAVVASGFPLFVAGLPSETGSKFAAGQPNVTPAEVMAIVETYRSGWLPAMSENFKSWIMVQGASIFLLPVTIPLMMLGLGLFKSGFLSGRSPLWLYALIAALAAANLWLFAGQSWLELGAPAGEDPTRGLADAAGGAAPLITLGYASLLILLTRLGLKPVTGVLAPVGRMAFTNYLSQTLIMVTLFYAPWGPLWFGTMGPAQIWGVVGAVWIAQLIWSPLWLSAFSMGPFEWLWRCLSYGRLVPIRKTAA